MTNTVISPTDTIAGLMACVAKTGKPVTIPTNRNRTHVMFYNMSLSGSQLLKSFDFDTTDMYPYSATLDEALENLQVSNDLERKNPKMAYFVISDSLSEYFDRTLKNKFNDEQLKELHQLCDQFIGYLSGADSYKDV